MTKNLFVKASGVVGGGGSTPLNANSYHTTSAIFIGSAHGAAATAQLVKSGLPSMKSFTTFSMARKALCGVPMSMRTCNSPKAPSTSASMRFHESVADVHNREGAQGRANFGGDLHKCHDHSASASRLERIKSIASAPTYGCKSLSAGSVMPMIALDGSLGIPMIRGLAGSEKACTSWRCQGIDEHCHGSRASLGVKRRVP